jgi:hypothetical protein
MQETPGQPTPKLQMNAFFQVLISGLGLLFFFIAAVALLVIGLVGIIEGNFVNTELMPFFSMAWAAGLFVLLTIPSLAYAFPRFLKKKQPDWKIKHSFRLSLIGMGVWLLVLLIGQLIQSKTDFEWFFLPPLHLLAVALPLLFLVEMGRRKLGEDNPERNLGIINFGIIITQTVVMVIEIILVILSALFLLFWISTQQNLLIEFSRLAERLMNANYNPEIVERIITPYFQRPGVIYVFLAFGAGLVPLVEELLKPLVLWLFVGRRFSPKEGFVMGLVAGATFALVESLGMISSSTGPDWLGIVIARFGTGLLHITTTSIVGWGLGAAWQKRQYLHLGLAYGLAVLLHGIWNLFGFLLGLAPFLGDKGLAYRLAIISPYALAVMAVILFLILLRWNRHLRIQEESSLIGQELPEPQ